MNRNPLFHPLHRFAIFWSLLLLAALAHGEASFSVVDIPTRPNVTQRLLVFAPQNPKAAVVLFAGGHGGLQIASDGSFGWGKGNFLVRSRQLFVDRGLLTVIVDAPSDRQNLAGFRQTSEHVADIKAVIAWVRGQSRIPVWLVGTSRGTQSAAYAAVQLNAEGGPDGLVLTSSILSDPKSTPLPSMRLDRITAPVLVVHHELDGCKHCSFSDISLLMRGLEKSSRTALLSFRDGQSQGDPCEAFAYHGFNGIEEPVVAQIADWILAK